MDHNRTFLSFFCSGCGGYQPSTEQRRSTPPMLARGRKMSRRTDTKIYCRVSSCSLTNTQSFHRRCICLLYWLSLKYVKEKALFFIFSKKKFKEKKAFKGLYLLELCTTKNWRMSSYIDITLGNARLINHFQRKSMWICV